MLPFKVQSACESLINDTECTMSNLTIMTPCWRPSLPGWRALAACTMLPERCLQQAQGGTVKRPESQQSHTHGPTDMSMNACASSVACSSRAVTATESPSCGRVSMRLLSEESSQSAVLRRRRVEERKVADAEEGEDKAGAAQTQKQPMSCRPDRASHSLSDDPSQGTAKGSNS